VTVKRLLDLLMALPGLLLLSPLFLVIAVWVKLDTPGPVFFRQARVGRYGEPFSIYKFRTMVVDADRKGPKVTARGDSRITNVGRLLRKYKLDEIPQLINVLKGEMSFVGPRPEVPEYIEYYPEESKMTVLSVRPGITDPASLEYFDENELLGASDDPEKTYKNVVLPDKIRIYEEYVKNRSIFLDLELIVKTLRKIVSK
jgi:lipopolysaccharide/colanic/teichoic acid biosynthesis glycosyltransferase